MEFKKINTKFKTFNIKLDKLINLNECILCSKLLYHTQCYCIQNNHDNVNFLKLNFEYNGITKSIVQSDVLKSCTTCAKYIKEKKLLYTYSNFSQIRKQIDEVLELNNYYITNKLCLITMYCKTLKTTSYSYLHQNGNPKFFHKNFKNFMGSVGLIYDEETIDKKSFTIESRSIILDAIKWLKDNNLLYKKYLCNYEKILNYLISLDPESLHMGTPMITKDHMNKLEILNSEGKFASSGILINTELENECLPTSVHEVNIGVAIKRRKLNETLNEENIKIDIKYDDIDTEALIYVHLFPTGTGNWYTRQNGMTLNAYSKMRLLHVDPRWRNDKYYIFYLLDTITQSRLITVNNMLSASTSIKKKINAGKLANSNFEDYYKYGSHIPKSITGSKNYWKSKYLDLLAIISQIGYPTFFLTFTANDSWPGLKIILSQYQNQCPIFHPVDVSEYFFQRFFLILKK